MYRSRDIEHTGTVSLLRVTDALHRSRRGLASSSKLMREWFPRGPARGGTMKSTTSEAALRTARVRSFCLLMSVGFVGLSLSLTGCGSSGPSKSYQQGWDRAVASPGYDCNTVPQGIASHSDWSKGCITAQNFRNIHNTTGHLPASTPTTYSGDP